MAVPSFNHLVCNLSPNHPNSTSNFLRPHSQLLYPARHDQTRQHRRTGQVTFGQSYAGYNQKAAGAALDGDSDDDDDKDKKDRKPAAAAAVAVAPAAVQYPPQYPPGVGYMPSPVHPMGYIPSPVPYGMSPVAMYPAAPWNAMPVSPVPMQVPEYIKKQVRNVTLCG